eukprot:577866_1
MDYPSDSHIFTVAVLLRDQQQHIARYSATKCRITHRYNIDYYAKSRIFHGEKVLFGICLIKHTLVDSFLSYFIAANVGICIIYLHCVASKSCAFIDNKTALLSFIFHHILGSHDSIFWSNNADTMASFIWSICLLYRVPSWCDFARIFATVLLCRSFGLICFVPGPSIEGAMEHAMHVSHGRKIWMLLLFEGGKMKVLRMK